MSKSDEQLRADEKELIRFYMEPDGLNRRARGIPEPIIFHDEAILNWFNLVFSESVEHVKNEIRKFPEYKEQHPGEKPQPNEPVQALHVDGPVFRRADNSIWRHKGFTCFKLLNLFEQGQDIRPILEEYKGYNAPRIFLYTPSKYWHNEAWSLPSKEAALDFVRFCNNNGFYPKITLATDDNPSIVEPVKEIVKYLERSDIELLYEAVNEPSVVEKHSPDVFKNILSSSRFIYSSGIYDDNRTFWGKCWLDHSPRDSEWYRKGGKYLYEAYFGGGPRFNDEPDLRMPCIEDEPIRPDQTSYDTLNTYAYAASCGLMGAGATFHSATGKYARPLTSGEEDCKNAFLNGLNVFPENAPLDINNYRRIDETGNENNPGGRTYVIGNYSIRIHQNGYQHPEDGWKPLDDFGVAFIRS